MTRRRKQRNDRDRAPSANRRGYRVVTWLSGIVCAGVLVGILAFLFLPTPRQPDLHGHPPGLHSGQVVVFKAGSSHYHVEFVVEPTGVVHLFPLDESATQPLPVDSQPLVFTVQSSPEAETYSVMLRPVPDEGTAGAKTTRFVGRLPARAVNGKLRVRFTEFKVHGERFRFEFDWVSPIGYEAFRAAFKDEQQRLFLSTGGKYLDGDIRENGGCPSDAQWAAAAPSHDHAPKTGDRLCPVSGIKAEATFTWAISGQKYWFCCQPCIDEFVLLAKEKPDMVKPVEHYVR
jgi:YHS domain-containing protein